MAANNRHQTCTRVDECTAAGRGDERRRGAISSDAATRRAHYDEARLLAGIAAERRVFPGAAAGAAAAEEEEEEAAAADPAAGAGAAAAAATSAPGTLALTWLQSTFSFVIFTFPLAGPATPETSAEGTLLLTLLRSSFWLKILIPPPPGTCFAASAARGTVGPIDLRGVAALLAPAPAPAAEEEEEQEEEEGAKEGPRDERVFAAEAGRDAAATWCSALSAEAGVLTARGLPVRRGDDKAEPAPTPAPEAAAPNRLDGGAMREAKRGWDEAPPAPPADGGGVIDEALALCAMARSSARSSGDCMCAEAEWRRGVVVPVREGRTAEDEGRSSAEASAARCGVTVIERAVLLPLLLLLLPAGAASPFAADRGVTGILLGGGAGAGCWVRSMRFPPPADKDRTCAGRAEAARPELDAAAAAGAPGSDEREEEDFRPDDWAAAGAAAAAPPAAAAEAAAAAGAAGAAACTPVLSLQ